jgi:hypothetical protein
MLSLCASCALTLNALLCAHVLTSVSCFCRSGREWATRAQHALDTADAEYAAHLLTLLPPGQCQSPPEGASRGGIARGGIAISVTSEVKELAALVAEAQTERQAKQPLTEGGTKGVATKGGAKSGAAPCPDNLPMTLRYHVGGEGGGWARFVSNPKRRRQPPPPASTPTAVD